MAGPCVGDDGILVISVVVDDARHGLPAVLDVVEVAPNVAGADDRLVVWLEQDIASGSLAYHQTLARSC